MSTTPCSRSNYVESFNLFFFVPQPNSTLQRCQSGCRSQLSRDFVFIGALLEQFSRIIGANWAKSVEFQRFGLVRQIATLERISMPGFCGGLWLKVRPSGTGKLVGIGIFKFHWNLKHWYGGISCNAMALRFVFCIFSYRIVPLVLTYESLSRGWEMKNLFIMLCYAMLNWHL